MSGVVFVLLALLAALNWQMTKWLFWAVSYRDHGPPKVAAGLVIGNGADEDGRRMAHIVEERLRHKFPVGTDVDVLRDYLKQQGFKLAADVIEPPSMREPQDWNTMLYYWGPQGPACTSDLEVEWKSSPDKRISRIDVRYGYGCM